MASCFWSVSQPGEEVIRSGAAYGKVWSGTQIGGDPDLRGHTQPAANQLRDTFHGILREDAASGDPNGLTCKVPCLSYPKIL